VAEATVRRVVPGGTGADDRDAARRRMTTVADPREEEMEMAAARRSGSRLPVLLGHRLRRLRWHFFGEEPELRLLPVLADPARTFLDVGAHRGLYLEHALGHFRGAIGLEPNPGLFAYLSCCFAGRAEIRQLALSDRPGRMWLYVPVIDGRPVPSRASLDPAANGPVEQRLLEVPVTTLDVLDPPPLAFVKIDVEGHEAAVLRGGRAVLGRDRPRLLVEIEERHHPGGSAAVFSGLAGLGYAAFHLDPATDRLRPCSAADLPRLQPPDRAKTPDGKRSRDYVNNFLFLHRDDRAAFDRLAAARLLDSDLSARTVTG
jgi:FkbM family methyltransferase